MQILHTEYLDQCLSLNITSKSETDGLVDLIKDRRLTVHVYDIDIANQAADRIQKHHDVIKNVIEKVSLESLKQ